MPRLTSFLKTMLVPSTAAFSLGFDLMPSHTARKMKGM